MHFKHYENPYSRLAQYVNCAAANPGADAGMYDASEQYKLSTMLVYIYEYYYCYFILVGQSLCHALTCIRLLKIVLLLIFISGAG